MTGSTPQHVNAGRGMRSARHHRQLSIEALSARICGADGRIIDPDTLADWELGWYQPLPGVHAQWLAAIRGTPRH